MFLDRDPVSEEIKLNLRKIQKRLYCTYAMAHTYHPNTQRECEFKDRLTSTTEPCLKTRAELPPLYSYALQGAFAPRTQKCGSCQRSPGWLSLPVCVGGSFMLGMVAQAWSPSTWEAEARVLVMCQQVGSVDRGSCCQS